MKKSFLLIIIALLFLAGTSLAGATPLAFQSSQLLSTFEGGSLYKSAKYPGRDRNTARLTLGVGLAVSAFPLSVPV